MVSRASRGSRLREENTNMVIGIWCETQLRGGNLRGHIGEFIGDGTFI